MNESSDDYSPSYHFLSTFTASSPPVSQPFSTPSPAFPPLRIPFNPVQLVVISIIFALLSLMTVAGNLFVIAAFRTEPSLRLPHNYFLISLAVADLAVGAVSLPFFGTYVIYGYRWPMGSLACDLWLALDYTMSSASAASLLLISLDRYYSIISPLAYRSLRTRKRVCIVITAAWITSGLVWCPGIFGYPYIYGSRIVPYDDCYIQFLKTNSFLTVITALFAFFIPVCVMVVLYFRIWRITEKRKKDLKVLMSIRPTGRQSGENSKRFKDHKRLKKTQYFKLHCLKLRQTLKNSAKTNRKSFNISQNAHNLEIQEFEYGSSVLSELQFQRESLGFVQRRETSDLKERKNLKHFKKVFNCSKLRQSLKNCRMKNKSTKKFSSVEDLRLKTSELTEVNVTEQPEVYRFKFKPKEKGEIQRHQSEKNADKNDCPKTSFDCFRLRQSLAKRKMGKQSIRDFQKLQTKEFEMHGTDFREVECESENDKLKKKPGVNLISEESEEIDFRQKLQFKYSDLIEGLNINTETNEISLKDTSSIGSNTFDEKVTDFVEDSDSISTEMPKQQTGLSQKLRTLNELKKIQHSQDETLNDTELSEYLKYERETDEKSLNPSKHLDISSEERFKDSYDHSNRILNYKNIEKFLVKDGGNLKNVRSSPNVSDDNVAAIKTTISYNEMREESTRNKGEVITISAMTNTSVRDSSLDEKINKNIRNDVEETSNYQDNITLSKTIDNDISPSTSISLLTNDIYSIDVKKSMNVNTDDNSSDNSLSSINNEARTYIAASLIEDNTNYNNDITLSNCSADEDDTIPNLVNDDDTESIHNTNTENTDNDEDIKQKHLEKHNEDSQTQNSFINVTKNAPTNPNKNNTNRHATGQLRLKTTTNFVHKKDRKSTKKQRRKKRPSNKRDRRHVPFSPNRLPPHRRRCFEEPGDVYTILINIPRGEGMGRPSIRLISGSVGFDQWHRSVDGCEHLDLNGGDDSEFENMNINEWEESDLGSDSESEIIEVWEGEEGEEEEEGGGGGGGVINNVGVQKEEFENININAWVESEDISQWEEKSYNTDENTETVGLSRTSLKPEVLGDVSGNVIETDEFSYYHHSSYKIANDKLSERVATSSLRETSDITTGTGTGSDTIETEPGTGEVTPCSTNERGQKWRKGYSTHRRMRIPDRKAAKTLSAILLVFIVTWLPYNVLALLQAFCDDCVNETLYAIGYWLCYLNSTINPLCYALCNANFRKAFIRIVNCQRRQYQLHPGIYAHRGLHTRGHLPV